MTNYFLKDKSDPSLNYFGTAAEIWKHIQEKGYEGETQSIDGYPLPAGQGISVEEGEDKRTGAISLKAKYWYKIDEMQRESPKFKSQGSIIEDGLKCLDLAHKFGPIYASTPEGIKKFNSLIELMIMKPYLDAVGFRPVICQDEEMIASSKKS